jgi:hypothetical protein
MHGEFCTVARYLIPTDAHVVCACLQAAGIGAVVVDDQYVQANLLLAPAIGGVRVLVPEGELTAAQEVLQAFERGDLAIDEDADVGGVNVYPFSRK